VPPTWLLVLSVTPAILISMGAFAINDYFDVKVDMLNKRKRPIVVGAISKQAALKVSIACFVLGVFASAFVNTYAFLIAAIFAILAFLYSYRLKELLLIGNIYIAFTMVIPFIYGNYVVANTLANITILISLIIFLSGFAREIHGMIRDYEGDIKGRNMHNIVSVMGTEKSALFAFSLYLEAIALSIFMFFFEAPFAYNLVYALMITVVDAVLFCIGLMFVKNHLTRKQFDLSRNLSLGAMALALIAFMVSALIYMRI
jgi:geranylgeranylglycerol-phosphate geranylgeranyltransferase